MLSRLKFKFTLRLQLILKLTVHTDIMVMALAISHIKKQSFVPLRIFQPLYKESITYISHLWWLHQNSWEDYLHLWFWLVKVISFATKVKAMYHRCRCSYGGYTCTRYDQFIYYHVYSRNNSISYVSYYKCRFYKWSSQATKIKKTIRMPTRYYRMGVR